MRSSAHHSRQARPDAGARAEGRMQVDSGDLEPVEAGQVRLQKFLSRAGVASRRKCEALILDGRVTVNGRVVTELGTKVDPAVDDVAFDGRSVSIPVGSERVVVALNKPAGYLTAMSDPRGGHVVSELVPIQRYKGLFPVGRLDRDTTGLLLFTTDGELGNALLHPSRGVVKRYVALVEGTLSADDITALEGGVELDDGMTSPARCEVLECLQRDMPNGARAQAASRGGRPSLNGDPAPSHLQRVALEIHEGRKRQVRRMFSHLGHEVVQLSRTKFGPIELGGLESGKWRELDSGELSSLYAACGLE